MNLVKAMYASFIVQVDNFCKCEGKLFKLKSITRVQKII